MQIIKNPPNEILNNVLANYLGQGWAALMSISFLPIYIKFLGFEAYGLIGMFAVLQSTLAVFDFGITATLMREAARYRVGIRSLLSLMNLIRSSEIFCGISNTLLFFSLWQLADTIANKWFNLHYIKHQPVTLSISLMGILIALRLQEGIYRGILQGLSKQLILNIFIASTASVRYLGAVVILIYFSTSVVSFFIWQTLVSLISLVVLAIIVYFYLPLSSRLNRLDLESITSVWRFSIGMMITSGFSSLLANMDRLVMSGNLRLEDYGKYSLAATTAGILYLIVVPITQAFYPDMVGALAVKNREKLIYLYHLSSQIIIIFSGSLAVIFIYYSKQILYVWSYNSELAVTVSPLLTILSATALINCIGYIGHNMQVVRGSSNILALISIFTFFTTCIVLPPMARNYGAIGGAVTWFTISLIQTLFLMFLTFRNDLEGEGFRWIILDTALPLIGALLPAHVLSILSPLFLEDRLLMTFYIGLVFFTVIFVSVLSANKVRSQLVSIYHSIFVRII